MDHHPTPIDFVEMLLAESPKAVDLPLPVYALPPEGPYDCQACGACCIEAGAVHIQPEETQVPKWRTRSVRGRVGFASYEAADGIRTMDTHIGGRCKSLKGEIGVCVGCAIYDKRPKVCADYAPGTESCREARLTASRKIAKTDVRFRGYGADWKNTVR